MSSIDKLIDVLKNSNTITVKLTNSGRGTVILKEGTVLPSGATKSLEELKISKSDLLKVVEGSAIKFFVGESPRIGFEIVENIVKKKEPILVPPPVVEEIVVAKEESSTEISVQEEKAVEAEVTETVATASENVEEEQVSVKAVKATSPASEEVKAKEKKTKKNKIKQ